MPSTMRQTLTRISHLLLLWVLFLPPALAFEPEPFELELEGFFYRGLPVKVTGTQTLTQRSDGSWRLLLEARGPFIRMEERSDFRWEGDTLVPLGYRYSLRAPFEREERRVRFQPNQNRIRAEVNDRRTDHEFDPDWYDPLSYTLLLLRDLERGDSVSEFMVVDRHDARQYRFAQIDHELAPSRAIVMSQEEPDRGDIFIILDEESRLPAHLLRWRRGSIDYQIRTLSGHINGRTWDDLPHWPNPRRNAP
ncbi:DUF3108 domain-containing protein [Natronospirillum operosum]|uniref:DUF3108 domain-containing protein n=1 Tax=Natronospirillum operosum TaxID=2759953 RepID=A0A4Z0WK61_9GAMM|nr:DUF3108 domain-containing protein [Natronospirillum operosum]TGG96013.1 DUF3108 domain-containing protein [Natronospirillum operosum]